MGKEAEAILQVKNLSKDYGSQRVLTDVSFSVEAGERVAIIGPSGSGKSTLINILTRSIPYDEGQILVDGQAVETYKDNADYAKKIGVIRQQFDLVNELEVIHNVLAGHLHDWGFFKSLRSLLNPIGKDEALSALADVGIESKAYNVTASLSGGEQQRVAIARLLIQQPAIFLADEPIASLDPFRADSVMELLSSIVTEKNKTLLASMHSVDHVLKYFSRVIGIRQGHLVLDSKIDDLTEGDLAQLYEIQEVIHAETPDALSSN